MIVTAPDARARVRRFAVVTVAPNCGRVRTRQDPNLSGRRQNYTDVRLSCLGEGKRRASVSLCLRRLVVTRRSPYVIELSAADRAALKQRRRLSDSGQPSARAGQSYRSQTRSRGVIERNGECEVSGVLTRVCSLRSVKGQVEK